MRRRERGMAMVYVAILLVVATVVAAVGADRVLRVHDDATLERARVRALHAADGGVELARVALAAEPAYRGETFEIDGLTVTVSVVREGTDWTVSSVAQRMTVRDDVVRRIDAVLHRAAEGRGLPRIADYDQR